MKALVGAFNQEKALVGAFSPIVQPVVEPMEHYTALDLAMLRVLVKGGEEAELARHHHQHHRHVHQHQTLASLSSFITDHNRHSMRLHQQLSCVINSVQAASSDS